jgi:hypothetical protein
MGGWLRRVKQRVAGPHVVDVVHSEVGVLEEMRGLRVDFEDIFVTELVRIEPLARD